MNDQALPEENEIRISPSINDDTEDLEEAHDNLRDPRFLTDFVKKILNDQNFYRFLLYWATFTTTTTTTTFTATVTLHSVECTPTGFGTTLC